MKIRFTLRQLSAALCMSGALLSSPLLLAPQTAYAVEAVAPTSVLQTYATQAYSAYSASLQDAKLLQKALKQFTKNPTEQTLADAKKSWLKARESYGLTEVFRLSEGPIDAEDGWVEKAYGNVESQINAWPLDEFMIDYTLDAEGKKTTGNIIDSKGKFTPEGEDAKPIDITKITPAVLTDLNENGGEANVTTGYHAIEFLLWGQDQDYNNFVEDKITTGAMTAGQRPLSDYTSDAFAERRKTYLNAAAEKLVNDLETVTQAWAPKIGKGNVGLYRAAFLGELKGKQANKNLAPEQALRQIIAGMGVFMKSELANERIAVAVLTPSEEDEHSCFSDNTHRDITQNFQGFVNVLKGEWEGKSVGPALWNALSAEEKASIDTLIKDIEKRIEKMNSLASSSMHFDYQIMPQNEEAARNIVGMKNQMRRLGDQMITVAKSFGISLTEDDVTDSEETKVEG